MKCVFAFDVKTNGSLKVKRRTLVITSCEEQPSSHPARVWEADDLKVENGLTEALEIPENVGDFQHGPASDKFLKHHFPWRQLPKHAPEYEPKLVIKEKKSKLLARKSINYEWQNHK